MLCEQNKCTGCMSCVNACRDEAIKVVVDEEGFQRPEVDTSRCKKCNKCIRACPILNSIERIPEKQDVYACWTKDEKVRHESSSGGIFTELSKLILQRKGVVFGAALNEKMEVEHIGIDNIKDLYKLRGSKYVQSNIGSVYKNVKQYLDKDIPVLFSGTPCQIAGLYGYLGNDYNKLFTCDLVCHGVPSPLVFKDYLLYLKDKYGSEIKGVRFRDKRISWTFFNMKVEFYNGKTYVGGYFKDPFIVGFLRDNFLRPSCYRCKFANLSRITDISIADFWGYKAKGANDKNNDKGISLVILNNEKGKEIFDECKPGITFFERTIEDAIKGNRCLSESYPLPKSRPDFWKDYKTLEFGEIVYRYMKYPKISFVQKVQSNLKYDVAKYIVFPFKVIGKLNRILNSTHSKVKGSF